ncbi:MAG: response regulator [Thermoplasmatota archaeon]
MKLDILIVDDDPADIDMLTDFLAEAPFEAVYTTAADGGEGLAQLREHTPDLVILDLNMPRMGGHEMLAAMQEDAQMAKVPVVVLTTSDRDEDVEASFMGKAKAFVTKPHDVEGFEALLQLLEDFARAYVWKK